MKGRFDPWQEIVTLREAMNSLIEEGVTGSRAGIAAMTGSISIDLKELPDRFVIIAPLPGVQAEDVDISILRDQVRIVAELKESEPEERARWLVRERRFGRFERGVTLPAPVSSEHTDAEFDAGILTIHLPKIEAALPKTIPVRARLTD